MASLYLIDYKNKHPRTLSGEQKQHVAIASAIASDFGLTLLEYRRQQRLDEQKVLDSYQDVSN